MQSLVLPLFAACLLIASAVPVDQQTSTTSDSQIIVQKTTNKEESEQSGDNTNSGDIVKIRHADNVDVVVADVFADLPSDEDLMPPEEGTFYLGDVPDVSIVDENILYRNAMAELEEEMMEAAPSASISAGFSLRKRNKQKKRKPQQPVRRRKNPYFRRNPYSYRRLSYYPFYYPYYYSPSYRPSSLRYY